MALVLLDRDPFVAAVGELALALLVIAGPMLCEEMRSAIAPAVAEMGFRDPRTGEAPNDNTISWALHDTLNRCRALDLLSVGGDWTDRSYGLTAIGMAMATATLRARAHGPGPRMGR